MSAVPWGNLHDTFVGVPILSRDVVFVPKGPLLAPKCLRALEVALGVAQILRFAGSQTGVVLGVHFQGQGTSLA